MKKQKKELKVSFLTIEIINLIEFFIGLGCFISGWIFKAHINDAVWILLQTISMIVISFSIIALETSIVERISNRKKISRQEYSKKIVPSNSFTFSFNVVNIIFTLLTVILITASLLL